MLNTIYVSCKKIKLELNMKKCLRKETSRLRIRQKDTKKIIKYNKPDCIWSLWGFQRIDGTNHFKIKTSQRLKKL